MQQVRAEVVPVPVPATAPETGVAERCASSAARSPELHDQRRQRHAATVQQPSALSTRRSSRIALRGSKLASATFAQICIKLLKLAARVRAMKTRVDVHWASNHPGSALVAQILGQALQVPKPRTARSG